MNDTSRAAEIYTRHRRDVHRYLLRMTGDADAASELTQETFLRVVRGLQDGGPIGHERGWVFAIARHLVFDTTRNARRSPQVVSVRQPPGGPEGPHHGGDGHAPPEPAQPATQALVAALRQALDMLPAADRDVFLLREVAGLSYAEIVEASGGTVDAVRSRLHRARAALRKLLPVGLSL